MINILIVEDNSYKRDSIIELLVDDLMIPSELVSCVNDIKSAKKVLVAQYYDLLILDLVLPLESDSEPSAINGVRFLDDIETIERINSPTHIIGLTEFDDLAEEFRENFSNKLWYLINYKANEVHWQDKLKSIVNHLNAIRNRFIEKSIVVKNQLEIAIVEASNTNMNSQDANKIFVSHASADKLVANEIIELLELIGVKSEQIFYSSLPEYGIAPGENFFERIKSEISSKVIVIFVLSRNFYSSHVCLCEMGAAWALSKVHIPMLIPPFSFKDISGVIPLTQGVLINDSQQINAFALKIASLMNIANPTHSSGWERKRDKIFDAVNSLISQREK